jgi:hypothetical protein
MAWSARLACKAPKCRYAGLSFSAEIAASGFGLPEKPTAPRQRRHAVGFLQAFAPPLADAACTQGRSSLSVAVGAAR